MKPVLSAMLGVLIAAVFAGCCCPGYHDPCTGYVYGGGTCCFQPFRWMREHKERKRYKKALRGTHPRHMQAGYHVAPTQPFQPMSQGGYCPNCQPQYMPMTPIPEGEVYEMPSEPPVMMAPPAEESQPNAGPPGSQKIEKPVPMPPAADPSGSIRTPPIHQELAPLPLQDAGRPQWGRRMR